MKIRVRYSETDQMGVAHHGSYVLWLEVARIAWLRQRGMSYRELESSGINLAVSELRVQYRQSALFDDEIKLATKLTEARSRRFRFAYKLVRESDDVLLATGESVHIPVDTHGKLTRIEREWLEKLQGYLET